MKYAVRNLELINEKDAVIPVTQRELLSSFGVYESLKVIGGVAEFAEDHINRLFDSAVILKLHHDFSKNEVLESIDKLVRANRVSDATVKIQLIGGSPALLFVFEAKLPVYPPEYYTEGVKVISFPGERIYPHAKSNCLLLNFLAAREAVENNALDAILVDHQGYALEGSRSNLFAVGDGELVTAGEGVLQGVTRKRILEIAERLDIHVNFRKIQLIEIKQGFFDEVFISSTSMGAIPVKEIDDINIGSSFPLTSIINKNLL